MRKITAKKSREWRAELMTTLQDLGFVRDTSLEEHAAEVWTVMTVLGRYRCFVYQPEWAVGLCTFSLNGRFDEVPTLRQCQQYGINPYTAKMCFVCFSKDTGALLEEIREKILSLKPTDDKNAI